MRKFGPLSMEAEGILLGDLLSRTTAISLFSPTGRRWPEGPDEGVREAPVATKTPSSPRIRSALLPAGEKREQAFRLVTRRILA
jgi:hypothetical protein